MVYCLLKTVLNRIRGVMVSVLVSIAVDHESSPDRVKPKTEISICCFSAKHAALRERAKTGWLGIIKMCSSGATCLFADCCFSELA